MCECAMASLSPTPSSSLIRRQPSEPPIQVMSANTLQSIHILIHEYILSFPLSFFLFVSLCLIVSGGNVLELTRLRASWYAHEPLTRNDDSGEDSHVSPSLFLFHSLDLGTWLMDMDIVYCLTSLRWQAAAWLTYTIAACLASFTQCLCRCRWWWWWWWWFALTVVRLICSTHSQVYTHQRAPKTAPILIQCFAI